LLKNYPKDKLVNFFKRSTNTTTVTLTGVEIGISTVRIATLTGMCSLEKKEKVTFHFRKLITCYCKSNYSVNVTVFGIVEKKLGFEKNGPFLFYFM